MREIKFRKNEGALAYGRKTPIAIGVNNFWCQASICV